MNYESNFNSQYSSKDAGLKAQLKEKERPASNLSRGDNAAKAKAKSTHRCFSWFELPDGTHALVLYRLDIARLTRPGWPEDGSLPSDASLLGDWQRGDEPEAALVLATERVWWPSSPEAKVKPLGRFWIDDTAPPQVPAHPKIKAHMTA